MRARLGAVLDGAGWSVGLAAALFVFALLYVALDFQSPEIVLWTGHHVVATEQQGLATFRWHGQAYTVDVPGFGSGNKVDIYFSPGDPSGAMADNVPDRVFAGLLVGGPVVFNAYYRTLAGTWTFWATSPPMPASRDWTPGSWMPPPVPSGVTAVSFGLALRSNGTLATTRYSLAAARYTSARLIAFGVLIAAVLVTAVGFRRLRRPGEGRS